jgi:hypothetical protein
MQTLGKKRRLEQRKSMACRNKENNKTPRYALKPFLLAAKKKKKKKKKCHVPLTTHPERLHNHVMLNSCLA